MALAGTRILCVVLFFSPQSAELWEGIFRGEARVEFYIPGDEFSAWVHKAGSDRLQNQFEFGNKSRDVRFGFD